MDSIRQSRDGRTLCEVTLTGLRSARWHAGADQTSAAFAFAATMRPALARDDAAIAAGWTSRLVRAHRGADAVRSYDETGAWTPAMDEAFAYGFVAYLRTAAWTHSWPLALDWWRPQIAGMMAACPPGDEPADMEKQLDDAMGALYGRLVSQADVRGVLPFPAPEPPPAEVGGTGSDTVDTARVRRRSTVVGDASTAPPEPAAAPAMFADLEQAAPRRLGPALLIVGAAIAVLLVAVVAMYFTVLRPSKAAAARAAERTVAEIREQKMSRLYDAASATFRQERWVDFAARVKDLPKLGRIVDAKLSEPVVGRDASLRRSATVTCDAQCVFGHATIVCRYADVGFSGEWLLSDLQVELQPDVAEPPYAATDDGADALARRFVYAFQNEDYQTVTRMLGNDQALEKLESFRESLIGDGFVTKLDRGGVETRELAVGSVRIAGYDIETSREQRSGTVRFYLTEANGVWVIAGVDTNMRFMR